MFYLQYEAFPSSTSDDFEDWAGAYINCWINASSVGQAMKIAENTISSDGWIIRSLEKSRPIVEKDYETSNLSLKYIREAQEDGDVYVFHAWRNEAEKNNFQQ